MAAQPRAGSRQTPPSEPRAFARKTGCPECCPNTPKTPRLSHWRDKKQQQETVASGPSFSVVLVLGFRPFMRTLARTRVNSKTAATRCGEFLRPLWNARHGSKDQRSEQAVVVQTPGSYELFRPRFRGEEAEKKPCTEFLPTGDLKRPNTNGNQQTGHHSRPTALEDQQTACLVALTLPALSELPYDKCPKWHHFRRQAVTTQGR